MKLEAIFSRAQLALDALIRDSGAQIAINMPLDSVTLTTDADRLLQVVINLFSNAIKHNDKSVPEITVSSQQIGTGKQAKLLIQIVIMVPALLMSNVSVSLKNCPYYANQFKKWCGAGSGYQCPDDSKSERGFTPA